MYSGLVDRAGSGALALWVTVDRFGEGWCHYPLAAAPPPDQPAVASAVTNVVNAAPIPADQDPEIKYFVETIVTN
jgi:hypothetical protein